MDATTITCTIENNDPINKSECLIPPSSQPKGTLLIKPAAQLFSLGPPITIKLCNSGRNKTCRKNSVMLLWFSAPSRTISTYYITLNQRWSWHVAIGLWQNALQFLLSWTTLWMLFHVWLKLSMKVFNYFDTIICQKILCCHCFLFPSGVQYSVVLVTSFCVFPLHMSYPLATPSLRMMDSIHSRFHLLAQFFLSSVWHVDTEISS